VEMRNHQARSSGRTFPAILLVAAVVALTVAVWKLSGAASANSEDPVLRNYLGWTTYLATVLLMLALAILAIFGIRWIVARFKPPPPTQPTSQVSAWEEAGKRFELPADDQAEGREPPSDV